MEIWVEIVEEESKEAVFVKTWFTSLPMIRPQPFQKQPTGYGFLFMVGLIIVLWFTSPWVSAQEAPKPKIQEWQMNGILAALDDGYPGGKGAAFRKVAEFEAKALAAFPKQSEEIAKRASELINDSTADSSLRYSAVDALGKLGQADASVVQSLTSLVNNSKTEPSLRSSAVEALRNLGKADAEVVQSLTNLVNDHKADPDHRISAAEDLYKLGKADTSVVRSLITIVNNRQIKSRLRDLVYRQYWTEALVNGKAEPSLRSRAVEILGKLGQVDARIVQSLTAVVNDRQTEPSLRISVAETLGKLGKADASIVQFLNTLVNDSKTEPHLRNSAVTVLGNLGKADAEVVQSLTNLVNDHKADPDHRISAVEALGQLGKTDARAVQSLTVLFNNTKADLGLRIMAAMTLENLGKADARAVPFLTTLVNNHKVRSDLSGSAVYALGELGQADARVMQSLKNLVNDRQADFDLRNRAVDALSKLSQADTGVVQSLTNLVNDRQANPNLRTSAAEVLGKLGKADASVVQSITALVNDRQTDYYLRSSAVEVLSQLKPLKLNEILFLIDRIYEVSADQFDYPRFEAYFYGGAVNESKTLLKWIGRPAANSVLTQLSHEQGKQTLAAFAKAWSPSANFPRIQSDLASTIATVAKMVQWQLDDIALLEQHYKNLSDAKLNSADSVKAAIDSLAVWKWFNMFKVIIALHLAFWAALIVLYPKFSVIQALFFWNPWVRTIAGLGYVSALLVTVPFLRQRLFAPFQTDLRRAAGLEQFDPTAYFPESQVKRSIWKVGKETEETLPLLKAIPNLKGQMLLQAHSGFGKTLFLQHLIYQAPQRTIVFLTATDCAQAKDHDVLQAIQAKLLIAASDPNFLKSLIYSGAIDICIDGLNEINAEAQASIKQFLRSYTKGNIILTTQPLSDKNPPRSATLYRLLPLTDEQIARFLTSRHPKDAIMQGTDYQQVCLAYLQEVLNPNQTPEDLAAIRRVLSNPMDLDTVAEMLAHKERPELFRLQQQQYNRMATEYADHNNGFAFPLKPIAQLAYDMRLSDQHLLPKDKLSPEVINSLEKHKLLTPKSGSWQFRHDKIWDFFIVQKYLEDQQKAYEELRESERMHDTRLRGVYLQLAAEMDLSIAQELEKALFAYASSTGDHTASDLFRKGLESRVKNLLS